MGQSSKDQTSKQDLNIVDRNKSSQRRASRAKSIEIRLRVEPDQHISDLTIIIRKPQEQDLEGKVERGVLQLKFQNISILRLDVEFYNSQIQYKEPQERQASRNHNFIQTTIAYIKIIGHNLVWDDFKHVYTLIASSQELEAYALDTKSKLAHFLDSWARFKKFNYVTHWLIDVSNSNSEHSNKFNFCKAINWPIVA